MPTRLPIPVLRRLLLLPVLCLSLAARAAVYNYSYGSGFANGGAIPAGNVSGWSDSRAISDISMPNAQITDISVSLNVSGGFNGDAYAYLSYNGVLVPLLNRVGVSSTSAFGYSDSGFNITLSSSAANDVHFYGNDSPTLNGSGQLTGTWQPDGRALDPLSATSGFDSSAGRISFSALNGLNPNGTWTLYFADVTASDDAPTVNGWSMSITVVPEPVTAALGLFMVAGLGWQAGRLLRPQLFRTRAQTGSVK